MCSGVAVVDERGTERAGDMAMLSFGPDAHQELDVIQGPGTALQVPVGPVQLLGVSSVHAYVPLVVLVEISPDPDDVSWAARMESEAEADVRDKVVEALLPIQRCASEWKGKGPSMLDAKGKGCADVANCCFRDRPETGSVGPSLAPGSEAPIGGGFPGVHPDRQHRQQPLICGEFTSAFT